MLKINFQSSIRSIRAQQAVKTQAKNGEIK